MISRRSFIKVAAPFAVGFSATTQALTTDQHRRSNDDNPPRAGHETKYSDGTLSDFDWKRAASFARPAKLNQGPGIYTIVLFVRRVPSDKGFSGRQVCVMSRDS